MTIIEAIIIGIIEGITEFLPISSTGHMILAAAVLKIHQSEFLKTFQISIQIGAILAIVSIYLKRFFRGFDIYVKLFFAFLPTGIIGIIAYPFIKQFLFNPFVVSVALIIGGIIIILIDKQIIKRKSSYKEIEDISIKNSVYIGLIQCLSMIPGVSRAAATIVGGVFNGFDKRQATEFSFLLAVPTMIAAAAYDILKTPAVFNKHEIIILIIGLSIAFISAWIAVKAFLAIITKFGFAYFGWYRILIGLLFLFFSIKGNIQM